MSLGTASGGQAVPSEDRYSNVSTGSSGTFPHSLNEMVLHPRLPGNDVLGYTISANRRVMYTGSQRNRLLSGQIY